ncbi:MAG: preprotein translocase subunit SecE [Bdellovibrionales bacterium]|nr:preprotein translocase subunit SecE [Bdellovibrionales bacterium]
MASKKDKESHSGKGFLTESVGELKKVSTPTRQETIQATLVTIVIMTFVAICLMVLDVIFRTLMDAVLG